MSTSTSSQPPTGQNPPRRSLPSAEGNPVQPKQALLKVLHTAGAKGDTFTLKQVMHYLGQYIMVKQLYDKQHQHIVNCGDDELGVLLGITSFSVKDPSPLYDMLKKNLHSVSCTDAAESPSRDQTQDTRGLERQKGPDEGTDVAESREGGDRDTGAAFSSRKHPAEDGDSPVSSKHPRLDLVFEEWDGAGLPWWFLGNLRPNYTPQSNGSTDIPSNQDIDTALVSDTTDDFWFLNDCRSDQINVEVKVEALESPPASEGDEAGENESTKVIELTIYGDDLEDTQSLSDDTDTDVTAERPAEYHPIKCPLTGRSAEYRSNNCPLTGRSAEYRSNNCPLTGRSAEYRSNNCPVPGRSAEYHSTNCLLPGRSAENCSKCPSLLHSPYLSFPPLSYSPSFLLPPSPLLSLPLNPFSPLPSFPLFSLYSPSKPPLRLAPTGSSLFFHGPLFPESLSLCRCHGNGPASLTHVALGWRGCSGFRKG
ncbi:protein Mdm4 isoform X1 [Ascaphus truei]|uniref:protein Mdm4 isoform X1 n=1 Tax=Ascaphus truei TaxID=8439 RepID=UPI003F5946BE